MPPPSAHAHARWHSLAAQLQLPAAVVDLDAFDQNAATLFARVPDGVTLRPATKSLRVPALLERLRALGGAKVRGWMTFSAAETEHLADAGFDDFLLAYPVAQPADAERLLALGARGKTVRAIVDADAHVDLFAAAAKRLRPAPTTGFSLAPTSGFSLALDLDVAWRLLGGRLHLGVRRSPLRDPAAAVALARRAAAQGLAVTGVMAYEAQVAGMRDDQPGSRPDPAGPIRRLIRRRSSPLAAQRRTAVVAALKAAGVPITLVNGGGTGSLAETAHDGSVTEVTAGSGFFAPHLFDGYRGLALAPAAFFLLPVTRFPGPGWVTAHGGGYLASGAIGADRAPIVHWPAGLTPTGTEGFGEVQTPFRIDPAVAPRLALGDPIVCRHAKAGELFERFGVVHLVRAGERIGEVPSYRGLGWSFG